MENTFAAPTIIIDITDDMDVVQEVAFGPVVPIFKFRHKAEALQAANATPYGLAAYFYTNDQVLSWEMFEQLEYGMVCCNAGRMSMTEAPFGGIKFSGFGREGSKYGIDEYTHVKTFHIAR